MKTDNQKTKTTIKGKATVLSGFSALVEASTDGSVLNLLRDQNLVISWEARKEHILCVGKTGSGKSTRVILPICFADIADPEKTVIVVDAQASEVARLIKHTRKVRGPNARIFLFNAQDPDYSIRWNPFQGIWTKLDAFDLAETMSSSIQVGKDDSGYFRMQAVKYLAAMIRAQNEVTKGNATGGDLYEILSRGSKAIAALAQQSGIAELESFASNISGGNKNDETTLCELSNLLAAWNDDKVVATTSENEFEFGLLDDEPCVVIYAIPEEAVQRLKPLTNAFLHRLLHSVMERSRANGGELHRPFTLIVDEFASAVGKIPDFHRRANTVRKRGMAILAAVQTFAQIHEEYGNSGSSLLAAFNHMILVPPVAYDDAVNASNLSGIMTVEEYVTSDGYTPVNVMPSKRNVLSPDEILNPPHVADLGGPRMTFLFGRTPPFQGWLKPAYEHPEYREIMNKQFSTALPLPKKSYVKKSYVQGMRKNSNLPPTAQASQFTDVTGWSDAQIRARFAVVQDELDWANTIGSARKWWEAFVAENETRLGLVLRLAEELRVRNATITDFFLAYVYSNTDNIQANLSYLDYTRLKKEEERKRREAA